MPWIAVTRSRVSDNVYTTISLPHMDRRRQSAEGIDDRQDANPGAIEQLVRQKVHQPDLVRPRGCPQGRGWPPPLDASLGLIPSWAREPNIGYKLINAQVETASSKPAFRTAWRARRCLIPADGFYEWTRRGGKKQPWLFGLKDCGLFAFARLWESWTAREGTARTGPLAEWGPGEVIETCTILTTAANGIVEPIHNRMPVILPPETFDPWLSGDTVSLGPYAAEAMTAYTVSTLVNRPANDDPRYIEPVADV